MTPKERAAMQQALEALECLPEMCGIEEAITALREALAGVNMSPTEQAEQEPVGGYAYKSIEEYEEMCGMAVNDAFKIGWGMARTTNRMLGIPTSQQPVSKEHEPVATVVRNKFGVISLQAPNGGNFNLGKNVGMKLYAAPVRTKDLTDDEILDMLIEQTFKSDEDFARAVIAADRRKNRG